MNNSNKAKKKNGNYFEILIRNTVKVCGINIDDKDEIVNLADTDEGRTAISIRKIGKNPSGYPRDYGKIKKDYQRMINGNK